MKKINNILLILMLILIIPFSFATPTMPHAFYGNVTNNGVNLETGCMICTEINGSVIANDCITTDQVGKYGINRKLIAQNANSGDLIKFKIGPVYSDITSNFISGNVDELNLTFTDANCLESTFGNDVIDGIEECDGSDLGGETCVSQGYESGTLSCNTDEGIFDTTDCVVNDDGTTNDDSSSGSSGSSPSGTTYTPDTTDDTQEDLPTPGPVDDAQSREILNTINISEEFSSSTSSQDLEVVLDSSSYISQTIDSDNINSIKSLLTQEQAQQLEEIREQAKKSDQEKNIRVRGKVSTYKVTDDTEKEVYRTKIELSLDALEDVSDVVYVQVIPKDIASHVFEVTFNIEPTEILNPDPVVKWEFDSLTKGETVDLSYFIKKKVDISPIFTSVISAKTLENVTQPEEESINQEEGSINQEEGSINQDIVNISDTTDTQKSNVWITIIAILVIIFAILMIIRGYNHKKSRHRRNKGLHKIK